MSVKRVAATRKPGIYGDGDELYLRVGPTGAKSWILRTLVHGRRRELGLGGLARMSLAKAREEARKLRTEARSRRDLDLLRKREELRFEEAAKRHL
ncbi:MAG: Arm DNA-binding domain-containing protein, partial [Pseudomonadota bacterium]